MTKSTYIPNLIRLFLPFLLSEEFWMVGKRQGGEKDKKEMYIYGFIVMRYNFNRRTIRCNELMKAKTIWGQSAFGYRENIIKQYNSQLKYCHLS